MPSPPKKDEKQQEFISRCIAELTENKEGKSPEQRTAMCYSMWRNRNKKKETETVKKNDPEHEAFVKQGKMPSIANVNYPDQLEVDSSVVIPKRRSESVDAEIREGLPKRMGRN
jgi:hypothetical protein